MSERWALVMAVLVLSCDPLPPPDPLVAETPGESREEVKAVSCEHPSVCAKCGLTLAGKFECSASFWRNCPGHQDARVRITRWSRRYQSGRTDEVETEQVLERVGGCR